MATDHHFPATGNIPFDEGHCAQVPPQMDRLHELIATHKPTRILEIGFNAGNSAEFLLRAHPEIEVVSVDIGAYDYVRTAKHAIDRFYPGRHTLILGDSTQAIPKLTKMLRSSPFDLIFIDGGHEYPVATADLRNCRALAHPDTIVIMDDTYRSSGGYHFNVGPTKAWDEAEAAGSVECFGKDEYRAGRGMSWGKYTGW